MGPDADNPDVRTLARQRATGHLTNDRADLRRADVQSNDDVLSFCHVDLPTSLA
jgi:hypothetical protein